MRVGKEQQSTRVSWGSFNTKKKKMGRERRRWRRTRAVVSFGCLLDLFLTLLRAVVGIQRCVLCVLSGSTCRPARERERERLGGEKEKGRKKEKEKEKESLASPSLTFHSHTHTHTLTHSHTHSHSQTLLCGREKGEAEGGWSASCVCAAGQKRKRHSCTGA